MCRPASLAEQKQEQTAGLSVQWQDLTVGVGPKRVPSSKSDGRRGAGRVDGRCSAIGSGKSTRCSARVGALPIAVTYTKRLRALRRRGLGPLRHKRGVAFVEQEDALLKDLTVRQTLTFAAALGRARQPQEHQQCSTN